MRVHVNKIHGGGNESLNLDNGILRGKKVLSYGAVVKATRILVRHPDPLNDLAKEVGLLRFHDEDRSRV
jgi:hypothetical protein